MRRSPHSRLVDVRATLIGTHDRSRRWLDNAVQDAERRGLPALQPLLEALARATSALRTADWNADATRRIATHRMHRDAPDAPLSRARLRQLARALRARETHRGSASPNDCLQRIAERNRAINAFITVLPTTRARRRARPIARSPRAAYRGPLHGVPISLKDLIDVEGTPTTAASRVRDGPRRRAMRRSWRGCARRARCFDRQDQPARVRARHDQRGLGVRAGAASARPEPIAGRVVRRLGGVGRWRAWPTPRSAPTPAARSAFRRPRAASSG